MESSPFHAYYKARQLSACAYGNDRLLPVFASSNIEAYPYQIAAALFALRSPYLKGTILCDEGSLGKTYEAMLVIAQMWYEGKQNILIVVPTPLLSQWQRIIEEKFTVPLFVVDSQAAIDEYTNDENQNPFLQDGPILTTYDFAAEKAEFIGQIRWDITVFEEAHHLRRIYTGENKGAAAIREAARDSYKLLLTATPMQNSILDLYGLINFIDDRVFPDEEAFYSRYFRKPENYPELAERVSKYCFRTTRPQVATYVKIPERIPVTAEYTPTAEEQRLYDLLDTYLQREKKTAFPKMERYDLALMLFRTLSSSTFALERTLRGVVKRLESLHAENGSEGIAEEVAEVRRMHELAGSIRENAKARELLSALKTGFAELKKLGANRKALIFTENRTTQKYLYDLLANRGYKDKVLTYSGDKTRDYTIMERFEKEAQILITTDIAAEGFNLEFCSFVINYDLPYNTLTIEQRINRCHRQGQQSDVIILNFLNRNNFADVRVLELINKRILQFSGIFGMSDDVLGNFGIEFGKAFTLARTKEEIDRAYDQVLEKFEEENKRIVGQAEQSLFTSFTKEVADKVTVTPQYIEQEVRRINDMLWGVVEWFFLYYNQTHDAGGNFTIDYEQRTVTAQGFDGEPPVLFYYWTGSRNKPYRSLKSYGMGKDFTPHTGRITLSSVIGRGVLYDIECADSGTVVVDGKIESCAIGLYCVSVRNTAGGDEGHYNVLVGKTETGKALTDEQCQEIMALPVRRYTESGHKAAHWLKRSGGFGDRHELDGLVDTGIYIQRWCGEMDSAEKEEIALLRSQIIDKKAALNKNLDGLRMQISAAEKDLENDLPRLERIAAQKKLHALEKELKAREQNLFFDGLRLEQELEDEIAVLLDKAKYTVEVKRQFVIQLEGENA